MNRLAIIALTGAMALMVTACDETKEKTTETKTMKVESPKMESPKVDGAGKVDSSTTTTTTEKPAE